MTNEVEQVKEAKETGQKSGESTGLCLLGIIGGGAVVGGYYAGKAAANLYRENKDELMLPGKVAGGIASGAAQAIGEHIAKKPVQAAAEVIIVGPAGVAAGAAVDKVMEAQKQVKAAGQAASVEAVKAAAQIAGDPLHADALIAGKLVGATAAGAAAAIKEVKSTPAELQEHRHQRPLTSTLERAAGGIVGGPVVEVIDVKTRKYADEMLKMLGWK